MSDVASWRDPAVALIRRFWHFAGWRAWRAVALMVAGAALEGVGLALVVPLMGLLMQQRDGRLRSTLAAMGFLPQGAPLRQLAFLLVLFVVVMAVRAVLLMMRDRMLSTLQLDFADRERSEVVALLAASRWRDIAGLRHARVTHVLGGEIPRVATALQLLLTTLTSAIMLAAQWGLILVLAPGMALLVLMAMLIAIAAGGSILRRAALVGQEVQRGQLSVLDRVAQLMGGLKLALAQNMQAAFVAEVDATLGALNRRQQDFVRRQTGRRTLSTVSVAFALAVAAFLGAWLRMPAPALIAALTILSRMYGPAAIILRGMQQLAGLLPSYRSLEELRRELGGRSIAVVPVGDWAQHGPIRFERVSYCHPQSEGSGDGGVHDVSLAIDPDEVVGVTGASGAGKTSFVDLLAGLLEPETGAIRVGDLVLDARRMAAWRSHIAYVAQDSYLFHDTIRRNLAWGLEGIDEAALWDALGKVGAAALVRAMPDGLETMVGERGGRLSGGERQRLALARAMLRAPKLLILDEATSALDIAAEHRLLAEITALRPRPTIVIVAHRRETLGACTRILRFDGGRLIGDSAAAAISANRSR